MIARMVRNGAAALSVALLTAGLASADGDTYRLVGQPAVADAPVKQLDLRADNNADTILTRGGGRGGFGGGGFRSGYSGGGGFRSGYSGGGYYGGYGRGYYGGYGGYYGGYGRGYYGGYYRPYYFGLGLGFGYGGYGYGGYGGYGGGYYGYSSPYYYYSTPYYYGNTYYGVSGGVSTPAIVTLNYNTTQPQQMPRIDDNIPLSPRQAVPQISPDGTYRYDGGPDNPVPAPKQVAPPAPTPTERNVSIPAPKKYTYGAYGEQSGPKPTPRDDKSIVVKRGITQ